MNPVKEALICAADDLRERLDALSVDCVDCLGTDWRALDESLRVVVKGLQYPDATLEGDWERLRAERNELRTERDALHKKLEQVRSYCRPTPLGWGIETAQDLLKIIGDIGEDVWERPDFRY